MFSLNYITLFPFSCLFTAGFFGISYIEYFTMWDFMNLSVDQTQNMLLDDAFCFGKCISGII